MRFIKDINIKKILSLFRQQEGSPFFNAKGVALGVFSGCFPFFGFQTLLGLFLAKLARGNILLAAVGTWISNPFTYLPLYYFNYKVGSILLNNHSSFIMEKNIEINDLWRQGRMFSLKLIIGSSLVGLLLASISGLIVFFMYKFRTRK
tara:strand:- start:183 stop:626 length:444 start_codon:yes stop_codon:yes gene_type:complete